jgi:hypothetical protein
MTLGAINPWLFYLKADQKHPSAALPHPSSLRRISMYASFFRISGALHPDVFDQP